MIDRNIIKKMIMIFDQVYKKDKEDCVELMTVKVDTWQIALAEYDELDVCYAVAEYLKHNKFYPTPSDLVDYIGYYDYDQGEYIGKWFAKIKPGIEKIEGLNIKELLEEKKLLLEQADKLTTESVLDWLYDRARHYTYRRYNNRYYQLEKYDCKTELEQFYFDNIKDNIIDKCLKEIEKIKGITLNDFQYTIYETIKDNSVLGFIGTVTLEEDIKKYIEINTEYIIDELKKAINEHYEPLFENIKKAIAITKKVSNVEQMIFGKSSIPQLTTIANELKTNSETSKLLSVYLPGNSLMIEKAE